MQGDKKSNSYFFQQVKGEIQFNYPPLRFTNKIKNKFIPFMYQKDEEWRFGKGDIRELNQKERQISQKASQQHFRTKEIFKIYEISSNQEYLAVDFSYSYPKDQNNQYYIVSSKARIPPIQVSIQRNFPRNAFMDQEIEQGQLYCQLLLCQQVMMENRHYYRMIYNGLSGQTKYVASNTDHMKFRGIKFEQMSRKSTIFRLFVSLYRENKENSKIIKDLYISKPICIIQASHIIFIDDKIALNKYFQFFGMQFMAPSRAARVSQTLNQEVMNFQRQLIKRGKKILNIIFLAYKFPNSCQIYAKTGTKIKPNLPYKPAQNEKQEIQVSCKQSEIMAYFRELIDIFLQTKANIDQYPDIRSNTQLQSNIVNPDAKLVFRIVHPLQKAKILIAEQYTSFMSIIVGKKTSALDSFCKLDSNYIKQFYLEYYKILKTLCPKKKRRMKSKFSLKREASSEQQEESQLDQEQEIQERQPDITVNTKKGDVLQEPKKPSTEENHTLQQNNEAVLIPKKKRGRKTNAERQAIRQAALMSSQKQAFPQNKKIEVQEGRSKRQRLQLKINEKKKQAQKEKKMLTPQNKKEIKSQYISKLVFPHEKQKTPKIIDLQLPHQQHILRTPKKEKQNQQAISKTVDKYSEINLQSNENEKILDKVKQEDQNGSSIHHYQQYNQYMPKFPHQPSMYPPMYRPQFPYYPIPMPYYPQKNQHCQCHKCLKNHPNEEINQTNSRYSAQRPPKVYYPKEKSHYRDFYHHSSQKYPSSKEKPNKYHKLRRYDSQSEYSQDCRPTFPSNSKKNSYPAGKIVSQSQSENDSRYLKRMEPRIQDLSRSRFYEEHGRRDFDQRKYEGQFRYKR